MYIPGIHMAKISLFDEVDEYISLTFHSPNPESYTIESPIAIDMSVVGGCGNFRKQAGLTSIMTSMNDISRILYHFVFCIPMSLSIFHTYIQ